MEELFNKYIKESDSGLFQIEVKESDSELFNEEKIILQGELNNNGMERRANIYSKTRI